MSRKKIILIPTIDSIKSKNLIQWHGFENIQFIVISSKFETIEKIDSSKLICNVVGDGYLGLIKRYYFFINAFFKHKISIVEIYPEGVHEFIFTVVSRIFGKKILILARGNEHRFLKGEYSSFQKYFFKRTYELSNEIIYREFYAQKFIQKFNKKNYFISNSIKSKGVLKKAKNQTFNFLYINSFKSFRYPELAIEAYILFCNKRKERNLKTYSNLYVLGVDQGDNEKSKLRSKYLAKKHKDLNIHVLPFEADVNKYYNISSVFLMPSSLTYLNNSLLESMSLGLVPIISTAPNSEDIIDNFKDGFILDDNKYIWAEHMELLYSNYKLFDSISKKTIEKAKNKFSEKTLIKQYKSIYTEILKQ